MAKLITLIESDVTLGAGTDANPMRTVRQFFSLEGVLLWEQDLMNTDAPVTLPSRDVRVPLNGDPPAMKDNDWDGLASQLRERGFLVPRFIK